MKIRDIVLYRSTYPPTFLFFILFFSLSFKSVTATTIPCPVTVSGVCGGETSGLGVDNTWCADGYVCSCVVTDCTCEVDEAKCGPAEPGVLSCGDSGTVGECGIAGGCGPNPMKCTQTGTASYECYLDYGCACVIGVTCPSDGECTADGDCDYSVDGSIINPDTGDSESIFEILQYDGPIIDNLPALLSPIFKLLFYVGVFIGILGIIYSGYLLMVSEGDPGRAKEGKEQFTAAILGSLFILLSVFILRAIIDSILGVNSGL